MKLLTTGNPKIAKGEKLGYLTNILHLAPANLSGFNVCPMATDGCRAACLNTAGRGGIIKRGETTNAIQKARIAKTQYFYANRVLFMRQLGREIGNAIKLAEVHGLTPVFRLNGTSDIRWENIPVSVERTTILDTKAWVQYPNVMSAFPTIQFYDYTKIANRRDLPANYQLTFSLADGNDADAYAAYLNGMNIAGVFFTLPETYNLGVSNLLVINGDESDLRFLDPKGVMVGLKAKGKAKKDTTGFVK